MPEVLIIVDQSDTNTTKQMILALRRAILALPITILSHAGGGATGSVAKPVDQGSVPTIRLASAPHLAKQRGVNEDTLLCPLTLNLPEWLRFPGWEVFQRCRDVPSLRRLVEQSGENNNVGDFWLPIVLTARGPLYAEAIGAQSGYRSHPEGSLEYRYTQPVHLPDTHRQVLYQMACRLLRSLAAPPGVYLMQWGMRHRFPWFDRLLPFPAEPAIASIACQTPDLFNCHWRCLTGMPLSDLTITASETHLSLP